MTRTERENWLVNIENSISFIASEIGEEVVNSTLYRFGANSIYEVANSDLPDVFGEFYAIETNLRYG